MIYTRSKALQKEDALRDLRRYVSDGRIQTVKSNLLESSKPQLKRAMIEDRDVFMRRYHSHIEERRQKLRGLLSVETEEYDNAMLQLGEKNTQSMAQQLRDKVAAVRARNESEAQAECERLRELQFRQNAHELRTMQGTTNEYKTKLERDIQIIEKQKAMEEAFFEEQVFAEALRRGAEEKARIEAQQKQKAMEECEERNRVLALQLKELQQKRSAELEQAEKEKLNFRRTWAQAEQSEKDRELQAKNVSKKLTEEVREHNRIQREMKERIIRREKEEDKRLIEDLVNRERELKRLEEVQKENYRKETKAFWQSVRDRSKELALNQKALDELLEKEAEVQWAKKAAVWAKEEAERVALMKDVYAHRYKEVEQRRETRLNARANKGAERDELAKTFEAYRSTEMEKIQAELRKAKVYQNDLISQIGEKCKKKHEELMLAAEEERKRKLAELEYDAKIAAEQRKAIALLEDIKMLKDSFDD